MAEKNESQVELDNLGHDEEGRHGEFKYDEYSGEKGRRRSSVGVGSVIDGPLQTRSRAGSRRESGMPSGPDHDPEALAAIYDPNDHSFTIRASILGAICGSLIAVSNMYLGLKTGITIGATLFATLLGTVVLAPIVRMTGSRLGIREHTCFQAAGTAAGGMNGGLVAPVLALFWNGFFTGSVASNIPQLLGLIFGAAGFGIVFAVSLRKFTVVRQNLVFPDGTAAAEVLLTMYMTKSGAEEGKKKVRVMLIFFVVAFLFAIVTYFIPILVDIPFLRYMSNCPIGTPYTDCPTYPGFYPYWAVLDAFYFHICLDPVFVASGFMVGAAVNCWFAIGAIFFPIFVWPDWSRGYLGPTPSFSRARDKVLMWPAVLSMLAASIIGILLQYEMFIDIFKSTAMIFKKQDEDEEPRELEERDKDTPWFIWVPLLIASIAFTFCIYLLVFGDDVSWWQVLIGVGISYPIAIVTTQILGRTNWGISATLAKLGMMILGAAGSSANSMLLVGNMISQSCLQTGEVCQCYKTGHLVNAAPAAQFNAQLVGTTVGGFASVFAFWLYTTAYPCILEMEAEDCAFALSAARAWKVLADALAEGISVGNDLTYTMTELGYIYTIAMPCITAAETIFTRFFVPERFQKYMPVWSVFYLAWLIQPMYSIAQFMGQCILWAWRAVNPEQCQMYTYSVASGLIAGGSIASIVTAVFNVLELPGLGWGHGY